ncbi:hypothetical protein FCM35_KLT02135 [Carex littledalei]|uniref:Nodulin-related protein 1 n=1 Tax=Carex littledalei TaxID=544730 RepID=A0A833RC88_9POAL|nr:hypothetical protein FCM35_KLT02135 [Carex littledalei]
MESKNSKQKHESKPSPANLFSSTQVVADAAKSTLRNETGKVDKGKAAGAAANILHAASHYGKLEEKSFGKYIEKAEGYLHHYESSHSTSIAGPTTKPTGHSSDEHNSSKPHYSQHESSAPHGSDKKKKRKEEEKSEGGVGDYIKLAQGLLGKQGGTHSGGGNSDAGSGVGGYVKLAQGFMKKH